MIRPLTRRALVLRLAATTLFLGVSAPPWLLAGDLGPAMSVFAEHCLKCHGGGDEVEGDVDLTDRAALTSKLELLANVIDVIDSGSMPPEGESPLRSEDRHRLLEQLQQLLREKVAVPRPFPPTPIRRMNRFQYSNAVSDLFELNVEVFALPERMLREYGNYFQPASGKMPDSLKAGSRPLGKSQLIGKRLGGVAPFPQDLRAENGFDNRGDHLSLSPLLLESFLKLSRSIVESPDFNEQTCGIWDSFFAMPSDPGGIEIVVRERLKQFLGRAFRRQVSDDLLDRYTGHVVSRIDSGESFEDAMKVAASSALASPRFLYLYDRESDNAAHGDDFDLASRLSFFLWGSIPDQTLLELAHDGRLRDRDVMHDQVDRMLNDVRMKRFCDSFPSQWLQMERIVSSVPDRQKFPEFYFAKFRVSMHMMLEPLLLFETVLVEDRPITELIDPQFSYRSDLLDQWYIDGTRSAKTPPTSIPFRRVALTDRRQGGVITNAAVMTMTSGPSRTQPITRGAWLASVIFNNPPKPPPADVPPLKEDDAADLESLTLRERFAAHRDRADCAACHTQIDPLGFALENYGPTGVWRDAYENGREVDASGVLMRKHQFNEIVEFKEAILVEKDRFARAFAEHLLSFALGRKTEPVDRPALDRVVRSAKASDYRLRAFIRQVVLSEPFLRHRDSVNRDPENSAVVFP